MVIDEAVECLDHLLASDEDLLGLLLTEKKDMKKGELLDASKHVQVEVLIEAYHRRLVLIKHQVNTHTPCCIYPSFYFNFNFSFFFFSHFLFYLSNFD